MIISDFDIQSIQEPKHRAVIAALIESDSPLGEISKKFKTSHHSIGLWAAKYLGPDFMKNRDKLIKATAVVNSVREHEAKTSTAGSPDDEVRPLSLGFDSFNDEADMLPAPDTRREYRRPYRQNGYSDAILRISIGSTRMSFDLNSSGMNPDMISGMISSVIRTFMEGHNA